MLHCLEKEKEREILRQLLSAVSKVAVRLSTELDCSKFRPEV